MRDQEWLNNLLVKIWLAYFKDVAIKNQIVIKFGRRARTRLGSISVNPKNPRLSVIRVNGLFKNYDIPEGIVKATIFHELCHYIHGFNSGHEQKFHHPHKGGVMRQEFKERGLENLYIYQKRWLKNNWPQVVNRYMLPVKRRRRYASRILYINFFK